jgi:Winged helix-turn helix
MRGRKPRLLTIVAADLPILQAVARARRLAWFQVQHARIVLAVAAGEPIAAIADRLECDPATVWRLARRYEQDGLKALLLDEPHVGRPQEISPPAACQNHHPGLPGADRRRLAHHSLVQQGLGSPGGR